MGLFYAYLRDVTDYYNQWFLTFANRETADEWWRMISTSPLPEMAKVKRISPQYYIQEGKGGLNSDPEYPGAKEISSKMFIEQARIMDKHYKPRVTTITPIEVTDHISGGWYFIRSKADRWSHWYFRTDGECLVCGDADCDAIHVSSEYRTKFCIRVRDCDQVPEDFVMIGKDEISIAAPKGYIVHINENGDLKATEGYQDDIDILFNDLRKRFITRAEKQVNGEVWEYVVPVERGMGETWELVD